jgi:hypothetical protein
VKYKIKSFVKVNECDASTDIRTTLLMSKNRDRTEYEVAVVSCVHCVRIYQINTDGCPGGPDDPLRGVWGVFPDPFDPFGLESHSSMSDMGWCLAHGASCVAKRSLFLVLCQCGHVPVNPVQKKILPTIAIPRHISVHTHHHLSTRR